MSDKLSEEFVGRKYFGPKIDITDPGYNKDTLCRMNNIEILKGEYECTIWKIKETYEYKGKQHTSTHVSKIGIYLNGNIPPKDDLFEIGQIGVDSGLAGFFMNKPDYSHDEWVNEFCMSIGINEDAWIKDEGFFSESGYGDGCYPVYAANNDDGKIIAVEIAFM